MINMAYDVLKREPPSGDDDAREESDADLPLEDTPFGDGTANI